MRGFPLEPFAVKKTFNKRWRTSMRLPPGLAARMKSEAKASGLGLNAWMAVILTIAVESAEERRRKPLEPTR